MEMFYINFAINLINLLMLIAIIYLIIKMLKTNKENNQKYLEISQDDSKKELYQKLMHSYYAGRVNSFYGFSMALFITILLNIICNFTLKNLNLKIFTIILFILSICFQLLLLYNVRKMNKFSILKKDDVLFFTNQYKKIRKNMYFLFLLFDIVIFLAFFIK